MFFKKKQQMATPFSLPNLDTEADKIRALGVKNSGVKTFRQDRVFPVNRLDTDSSTLTDGKLLEYRIRSDSSQWINWRETKIKAEFEVALTSSTTTTANPTYVPIADSIRMTALPIHAIFDGGMQNEMNAQLIENNTHPYTSAMLSLHTRTDPFDVATSGSGSLMSLDKRTGVNFKPTGDGTSVKGVDGRLANPKCAILQDFYQVGRKRAIFEVAEPLIGLQSLQHGYFQSPSDIKLTFQVANNYVENLAYDALAQSSTDAIDDSAKCKVIVNQTIPAVGDLDRVVQELCKWWVA